MAGTENIFARRSPSLKKLSLVDKELSDDEMINLMLQEPKLVRRPLIKVGGKLMVGGGTAAVEAAIAEARIRARISNILRIPEERGFISCR